MEIKARNTNQLMWQVYRLFTETSPLGLRGRTESRNGPVIRFLEPVSIELTHPWERVNFSSVRDANPFFHLMEGIAMLFSFNRVGFLAHFAKNMASFSDDGKTFNAFYGTRAREWRLVPDQQIIDQLNIVIRQLREDPLTRQAVVQLWDPVDLLFTSKDKACNLTMLFEVKNGNLCMTTFNRSNDAVLGGVSGANIVHLSMFQEYVACAVGRGMGSWWHVSNNLHVYEEQPQWERLRQQTYLGDVLDDPYTESGDLLCPLLFQSGARTMFDDSAVRFLNDADKAITLPGCSISSAYADPFIDKTVVPMFNIWQLYKQRDLLGAQMLCSSILAEDWRMACHNWLDRRLNKPTTPTHE